ncbi:MAG: 3'(2'),5'-bisphosphate nucleotidase CysQ [Eubacteriales bacterium]|jgi:3'(2'), 5'-bisphosphate nucleotidase
MSENIFYTKDAVTSFERQAEMGQYPCVFWFCGLSGSGKTTVAKACEKQLHAHGFKSYLLDGDNLRHGLNSDLGFSDDDRRENIRRAAETASLMAKAGLVVLVSAITPTHELQDMARKIVSAENEFILCHVSTPLEVCKDRDPKGLYKKALAGEIKYFTGIDAPFDAPISPEVVLDTSRKSIDACADEVMAKILDLQLDAEDTAEKLCKISVEAGEAIMEVYGSDDFNIETKDDRTPVTAADKRSNAVIVSALNRLWPEISVLAEESEDNITRLRRRWCFVVDPLDGTKEFISRNGEFTVNIALVFDGNPVIGVIYVPVTGELYKGINWRGVRRAERSRLAVGTDSTSEPPREIKVSDRTDELVVMQSRSFGSDRLDALLEKNANRISKTISSGSSLKGCRIADGRADIYYRFGLTHEWDTAAMQCIIEAAGGVFRQMHGQKMTYNRPDTLNRDGFYILNRPENALE